MIIVDRKRTPTVTCSKGGTGLDFCAVIRIGHARDNTERHIQIIEAQTELCKTYDKAVLVSTKLAGPLFVAVFKLLVTYCSNEEFDDFVNCLKKVLKRDHIHVKMQTIR